MAYQALVEKGTIFMRLTAEQACLNVDYEKCTQCGLCTKICWTHAMVKNQQGYPVMSQADPSDSWHSCWACQRCMAVCPTGALSICGKDPSRSVLTADRPSPQAVETLMLTRRTCRNYKDEDVDRATLEHILKIVGNAPSGGCHQQVEFTVFPDKETFARFKHYFWERVQQNAEQGIFPEGFNEKDFALVKKGMDHGKDVIFRGAPNLLLIHAAMDRGDWVVDTGIAMSYAELLFNAYGLGTVVASFAGAALKRLPDVRTRLGIPENHVLQCPLIFGVPAITFPRGVQRFDHLKIHTANF